VNDTSGLVQLMLMNTLGMSVLLETLYSAASYVPRHSQKADSYKCFLFVQGSGLEKLLDCYLLDYDANIIRNGFNWHYKRNRCLSAQS